MKLYDYLIANNLSDEDFAKLSRGLFTKYAVQKYKSGQRWPMRKNMLAIIRLTKGAVRESDFDNLR